MTNMCFFQPPAAQPGEALTAVRFDDTGLGVACGTAGGLVALFDLRAQRPTVVKDHMYGQRITDIKFHASGEGGAGAR
jgi:ribosome biogenesis protein ENP2